MSNMMQQTSMTSLTPDGGVLSDFTSSISLFFKSFRQATAASSAGIASSRSCQVQWYYNAQLVHGKRSLRWCMHTLQACRQQRALLSVHSQTLATKNDVRCNAVLSCV
jgi:hypothetical protein